MTQQSTSQTLIKGKTKNSNHQQLIEQDKRKIQAMSKEIEKEIAKLTAGENKSQQPIAKWDLIQSFLQKSKNTKKNKTSSKGSNEEFLYESTGAHKNKPTLVDVFEKDDISDNDPMAYNV